MFAASACRVCSWIFQAANGFGDNNLFNSLLNQVIINASKADLPAPKEVIHFSWSRSGDLVYDLSQKKEDCTHEKA